MTGSAVDRRVELGGVYNVRDLGGVPTEDGHIVRPGMLFRASSLHRLTDEEAWSDLGAATVIDLRYQREIDAFPLPDFIEDATHAPVLPEGWQRGREDQRREDDAEEHLAWVYEVMLELGQDTVRTILDQLADADGLPAIFFYGLFTVLGQVLNAQERFAAFTWAPVLCNVVWIVGLGWFLAQYGHDPRAPGAFTPSMILLLGGSLTVGVAIQALILLIPLYRTGFRYRPRFGFRGVGLGSASRVAMWTFAALAVSRIPREGRPS